jgi:hypothetical protein
MRVYKIEYREYEYQAGVFGYGDYRSGYVLTHTIARHVMADNTLDAVDLLRSSVRSRIEVGSIEQVCKVDIKKRPMA